MVVSAPPALSNLVPSGVPPRLAEVAHDAKERVFASRTLKDSDTREPGVDSQLPVLPPDTTREAFNIATKELRADLGVEHVVLNDKPLVDGWYMEHPYVLYGMAD